MQTITLNNGVKMPQLGLGVFQILDSNEAQQTVLTAIKHGYRLFDTAAAYHNEAAVGEALKASGVPREELFITSKLWIQDMTYEAPKMVFNAPLIYCNSITSIFTYFTNPSAIFTVLGGPWKRPTALARFAQLACRTSLLAN